MKIIEKLNMDKNGLLKNGPINIVILGDSVSHGAIVDNIDYENVYWNRLKRMLNNYRDYVPVNMICASVGGTTAKDAVMRLDSQVLCHHPDLVIVSFGLNDVNHPLEEFHSALQTIFEKCLEYGSDVIYMTPNMLNTYVSEETAEKHLRYAAITAQYQNEGRMDLFMNDAVCLAEKMGVAVCNCYQMWKKLSLQQDTTLLLANRINHPLPHMHQLFADCLYSAIIDTSTGTERTDSTMFETQS